MQPEYQASSRRQDVKSTGHCGTTLLDKEHSPIDASSLYSMSPICPAPLCRQFWKAGNYDSGLISKSSSKSILLSRCFDDFKDKINDESGSDCLLLLNYLKWYFHLFSSFFLPVKICCDASCLLTHQLIPGQVCILYLHYLLSDFWSLLVDGTSFLSVHPKFLHSNATSHKWAFGGMYSCQCLSLHCLKSLYISQVAMQQNF